jgi:hypothetical protein
MTDAPRSYAGHVAGVGWEARPEWLAGRYWWRVFVNGHPKVLVRYTEFAIAAAEALAADEARFRSQQESAPE